MSEVDFYRDHIDGLRSQLMLRDRKIEQLEKSVTAGIKEHAAFERLYRRLISLDWRARSGEPIASELADIVDTMKAVLEGKL